MENNQTPDLLDEEIKKRHELAYRLSKEIVEELKYEDFKENGFRFSRDGENHLYKHDLNGTMKVLVELWNSTLGYIDVSFTLSNIVHDVIWLFEFMSSEENFPAVVEKDVVDQVKKLNIDVLTLFDLKESEVPEFIETHAKSLVKLFLVNLQDFAKSLVSEALQHSKIGYYKNFIKPPLKKHWRQLGFPDDFDLLTQNQLNEFRKNDSLWKGWFSGDKKQLLDINTLADSADVLRKEYVKVKNDYTKFKAGFYFIHKRPSADDFRKGWLKYRSENFSHLNGNALDMIEDLRPHELAREHLADIYDYDEDSIRKKLIESRKLRSEKSKKDKSL